MTFHQEYLLLVFLLCSGAVQAAAAYSGLRGLQFFSNRRLSAGLGMALVLGSLVWFFHSGGRNLPDTNGGIAGASQFGLFVLGGFLALLFTFLVTSFANRRNGAAARREPPAVDTRDGLPSLSETTFLQALCNNLRALWKLYRKQTQRYSSG